MLKTHLLLLSVVCSLAAACSHHSLQWACNEDSTLEVVFSTDNVSTTVECNKQYPKSRFDTIVDASYPGIDEGKTYTLIMIDPDAPGSFPNTGWLHYILSGISGSTLANSNSTLSGDIVTEYAKPTPPSGSGIHRYFIYLYEKQGASPIEGIDNRAKFDIEKFVSDENLCGPVAMNMFKTQN